jgi:hypothetical protein
MQRNIAWLHRNRHFDQNRASVPAGAAGMQAVLFIDDEVSPK